MVALGLGYNDNRSEVDMSANAAGLKWPQGAVPLRIQV